KLIFKRVLVDGILTWSANFKRRCRFRRNMPGFNTVDAANVIRRAKIIQEPVFNESYYAWEYRLCDKVDGRKVMVIVLMHCDCEECGAKVPEIPAIDQLHQFIAIDILRKKSLLSGEEIRFLRKMAGLMQSDLAEIMGVHATRPSKWETDGEPIGKENDRVLRS